MPDFARTNYSYSLKFSCYLFEGVFTRRDVIGDGGKHVKAGTYASEVKKGDIVQVYTDSWSGSDGPIVAAQNRDSTLETNSGFSGEIGIVVGTPEGRVPAVAADGGLFTASKAADLRFADVVWLGRTGVLAGKVADASKAGTFVGWDSSAAAFTTNSASVSFRPYVLLTSVSAGGTGSILF